MKRYILLPLLAATFAAQAQDSYMNERLTNNSSDVIGTARYVGMGGALGALGADISVISWNPAGIGLYRKNDIALTMGGIWGKSHISEENRGKFTFDQAGFVYNIKTGSETCPYVNFAFNYQKKINFHHNFYADNGNLNGLSQMDQLAELTDWDNGTENLEGMALDNNFFNTKTNANGEEYRVNKYGDSYSSIYTHHSEGGLHSFDFNLSTNIKDRAFLGLTVGVDNMRYRGWNVYGENDLFDSPKYDLRNYDVRISGTGVNVKFGAIIRPIEDNSFRFGFAVETPTWYRLRNDTIDQTIRISLNAGFTHNAQSQGYTYDMTTGVRTYRPENISGGNCYINSSVNWTRALGKQQLWYIGNELGLRYNKSTSLAIATGSTNSELSRVETSLVNYKPNIRYQKKDLTLNAKGDFSYRHIHRNITYGEQPTDIWDIAYGLNGTYKLPWNFTFDTDLMMHSRRGYTDVEMNDNRLYWDASLTKSFHQGQWVIKLRGYDLLGQVSSLRYSINSQGRTETWTNSMRRYALLTVAYRFSQKPKKENK